jgi:hypothetical protein
MPDSQQPDQARDLNASTVSRSYQLLRLRFFTRFFMDYGFVLNLTDPRVRFAYYRLVLYCRSRCAMRWMIDKEKKGSLVPRM